MQFLAQIEQSGIKTVNAPVQLCKYILKKNQQIN